MPQTDPTPPAGDAAGIPQPTAEDERVLIYLDEMLKDWKNVWSVTAVIRLLAAARRDRDELRRENERLVEKLRRTQS